jgi:hypothetical protein
VVFTIVLWTAMLAFELLMLWAFGFHELGLAHALGLLVVLSFAIALPQAPAGVGVVQLASETTLTALYGMPIDRAKAFAIGLWACQVAVVVGAGAVALWIEGLSVAEIRRVRSTMESAQANRPDWATRPRRLARKPSSPGLFPPGIVEFRCRSERDRAIHGRPTGRDRRPPKDSGHVVTSRCLRGVGFTSPSVIIRADRG